MKGVVLEKETLKVCTIYIKNDSVEACLKQDFPEENHLFVDVSDDVTIKNIKVNPDGTVTTDTFYLYSEIRTKKQTSNRLRLDTITRFTIDDRKARRMGSVPPCTPGPPEYRYGSDTSGMADTSSELNQRLYYCSVGGRNCRAKKHNRMESSL